MVLHHCRNHLISSTAFPRFRFSLQALTSKTPQRQVGANVKKEEGRKQLSHRQCQLFCFLRTLALGFPHSAVVFDSKHKDTSPALQKWMTEEGSLPRLRIKIVLSNDRYAFGLESVRCAKTSKVTQYEREMANRPNLQTRKINEKASSNFNGANFIMLSFLVCE